LTDAPLYARMNRRRTHVVCVDAICGGRFGTLERNVSTDAMVLPTMDVGGPVIGYHVIHAGEAYVELLEGFMAANQDGVWRVPRSRRDYWRAHGLAPQPRHAHGQQRAIPELPARAECFECLRVQVLDAGMLGIAPRTSTA
jgi:hypothetical protein